MVAGTNKISSEDIELALRKIGKEHCWRCGYNIRGSQLTPLKYGRIVEGKEQPICKKCEHQLRVKRRFRVAIILLLGGGILALVALKALN